MTPAEQNACFARWMTEHLGILHRVARAFAEESDRHDLLQELMLAVWRAVPAFRREAKASTFIYGVSHHAAMTWKRAQRNYRRKLDSYSAEPSFPSESAASDERLERIYGAIRTLPAPDRSLILLSLDGLSYREMAELHGLSESNVGVRLNRIRQRLTHILSEEKQ